MRGSAVLLIAGEAAKPSSIRVPSQTTVGLEYKVYKELISEWVKEMVSYAPGMLGISLSGVTLTASHDAASRVEGTITCQYLGAYSAPKVLILGVWVARRATARVWEYRDIGGLFITLGWGRENDR